MCVMPGFLLAVVIWFRISIRLSTGSFLTPSKVSGISSRGSFWSFCIPLIPKLKHSICSVSSRAWEPNLDATYATSKWSLSLDPERMLAEFQISWHLEYRQVPISEERCNRVKINDSKPLRLVTACLFSPLVLSPIQLVYAMWRLHLPRRIHWHFPVALAPSYWIPAVHCIYRI